MFAENEIGNIWNRLSVAVDNYTVDDRKFDIRVIGRHLLHDRPLGKPDADYQVEILLGKSTHRRLDRCRIARLDIIEADIKIILCAFYAFPRSSVERAVIFAANVKNNADAYLAALAPSLRALRA